MDFSLIAALSGWLDPAWWWAVLQVVFGLGLVIFVHELGHFLAAKSCGVKCEKFYVGFDAFDIRIGDRVIIPRKLVHFHWGETEYGIGILPLGGYVKMLGQDDNPSKAAEERERAMTTSGDGVDGSALDPRSYMAKTVPQRMLIISAGVIMNLIFAVIFAAIAFKLGVNYEPPMVGKTVPGSPAWVNNLDGSRINEISGYRTDNPDVYFTFNHLRELIVLDSYDGPLEMEIERPGASPVNESIEAASNLIGIKGGGNLKSLGIERMLGTTLSANPTIPGQAADRCDPPMEPGDRIVEIEGQVIANGHDMTSLLTQYADRDVNVKVQRGGDEGQLIDLVMPANPARTIGIEFEPGRIRAIRKGSPAEKAGIRTGDTLAAIDGQPIGDVFTLQQRLLPMARAGQEVKITVLRYDTSTSVEEPVEQEFALIPVVPFAPAFNDGRFGTTIESLGINLDVKNVIQNGGAGEDRPLPGDRVVKAALIPTRQQQDLPNFQQLMEPADLKEYPESWPAIHGNMQLLEPGSTVKLEVDRDGTIIPMELTVTMQDGVFLETRGFIPKVDQEFYQNASIWVATKNGFRQTIDDASRVLKFLKKLVRGQLSPTNFGGPGTIAIVATSEATQGTSRLLLFLTLLSANLAIINFLPIPVLDGGHMVFLAYEGIFRRPVNEKLQMGLTVLGFVFLIGLMVMVIGLDVWRFS
ncbi:MAG: site-2 protease family protein [Pirellulaceae bacterium]